MRKNVIPLFESLFVILLLSCGQNRTVKNDPGSENRIVQQEDGTLSLKVEKAACYSDPLNPSNNTADWNVVISKPGRFKVWLSSATRDTSSLSYSNSVKVNILDDHLEVNPVIDKIVRNSEDVPSSYFRADSYVGSFYVPEAGEYNVQVISEKIIANNAGSKSDPSIDDIILMSLILTPSLR
jgi:hypothetical protein